MQAVKIAQVDTPTPGSDRYYAWIFSPKKVRTALAALFALAYQLEQLGKYPKDPQAAQHQLLWWLEQTSVQHLPLSLHPLLRAIQTVPQNELRRRALSEALQGMVRSALNGLTQSRYLDRPALIDQLLLSHGAWAKALALLIHHPGVRPSTLQSLLNSAEQLGLAWGLGQVICRCAEDASQGLVLVPVTDLQAAPIRAHELIKGVTGQLPIARQNELQTALERLLDTHRLWFEDLLTQAMTDADTRDLQTLKPLLIMLSLTRHTLSLAREHPRLDGRPLPQPSPLRKLWLAWKIQALGRF